VHQVVDEVEADRLGRGEPQHRAELGQRELPAEHGFVAERFQHPPGRRRVLPGRVGRGRTRLPAGQVRAVPGEEVDGLRRPRGPQARG